MLARALVAAHDALDVLVLIGTVSTVLRVLRGCLAVDERDIGIFEGDGVNVRGQRVQIGRADGRRQGVEAVGQGVQAGGNGVDERGLPPGAGHQSHGRVRLRPS